jgi:dUTPase
MRDELIFDVARIDAAAKLPERKPETSVGYDICACLWMGDVVLKPSVYTRIPTGIAVAVHPDYFLRLTARSSMQHVVLEGVIDPDYRGQVIVEDTHGSQESHPNRR